jgi:hypothetical protein
MKNDELHNLYSSQNDQIMEDQMGMLLSMHMSHEKCMQKFSWKILRKKTTWDI